jgi:hypothetical protein
MHKVLTITTDNEVNIKEVDSVEYETLYEAVNGLVELVSINEDVDMWLNEDGKVNGLEPNVLATLLFNKVFPDFDVIMGDVIITGGADDEGNTVGLSDSSIIDIFAMLQDAIHQAVNYSDDE